MTYEQWLVYLYDIYPEGGWKLFWLLLLISSGLIITVIEVNNRDVYNSNHPKSVYHPSNSKWFKLGWKRFAVPIFAAIMLFLSNLVPSREGLLYIMATPYAVEAGKSLVDSIDDPTSKLYKLNQLTDNALDKAIKLLEDPKQNQ